MKPASGRRAAGLELGLLPPRFAVTMEYGRPFPFRSSFVDTEHLPRAKHCAEAVGMQRQYGTGLALSFRRGRRGRWTRSAGQPGGWRGCACPWLRTEDRRKGARPPRGSTLEQSSLTLPNVTQGKRVENRERRKAPYMAGPPPPPVWGARTGPEVRAMTVSAEEEREA